MSLVVSFRVKCAQRSVAEHSHIDTTQPHDAAFQTFCGSQQSASLGGRTLDAVHASKSAYFSGVPDVVTTFSTAHTDTEQWFSGPLSAYLVFAFCVHAFQSSGHVRAVRHGRQVAFPGLVADDPCVLCGLSAPAFLRSRAHPRHHRGQSRLCHETEPARCALELGCEAMGDLHVVLDIWRCSGAFSQWRLQEVWLTLQRISLISVVGISANASMWLLGPEDQNCSIRNPCPGKRIIFDWSLPAGLDDGLFSLIAPGMFAPAHHARMSTPAHYAGMPAPTHLSGLSEPTQHAGVFTVSKGVFGRSAPLHHSGLFAQTHHTGVLPASHGGLSRATAHVGVSAPVQACGEIFQVVIIGIVVPEIDIFVSSTGNSNISIWTAGRS